MGTNIRLAVCIPTYNRSQIIQEFLETYINEYIYEKFDIYIYDSSEDRKTETLVREWMQYYTNLYYVSVDMKVHSNMKVYNIFREFGEEQKYDYLWVCSDSIRWKKRVLESVKIAAESGYDLIIPNYRDIENIGNKEYHDANKFFLDCAWHMTLYGATILKISTMLSDVDWEVLIRKYTVPECINHSHVAFYFEKLSKMEEWSAIHLAFSTNDLIASGLKKYSGWQTETFYVWCHCWPTMIKKLPKIYSNKNKKRVIKKSGINSTILSYSNLYILRKEKILDYSIYRQYKHDWRTLTNVPNIVIKILSVAPDNFLPYLDIGRIRYNIKENLLKRRIRRYCSRYEKVYIYGAGIKAQRYTSYLDEYNIEFEAYLVSDLLKNAEILNNHKVALFSNDLVNDNRSCILLALNEENAKEVCKSTLHRVDPKKIFSEYKI